MYAEKRKPGPRRGAARGLHDKIEQLQKSLGSLSSQVQAHLTPPVGNSDLSQKEVVADGDVSFLASRDPKLLTNGLGIM